MENGPSPARSEEIALSSLIFRIHAALTIPPRPNPRRRKKEKKERENGKHRSDFVACLCNKFSIVFPTDRRAEPAVARESGTAASGPPSSGANCFLRRLNCVRAAELKSTVHSSPDGAGSVQCCGAEGARSVWCPSLCSPSFICFHFVLRHDGNSFIAAATVVGRSPSRSVGAVDETQNCAVTFPLENESCGTAVRPRPCGRTVW